MSGEFLKKISKIGSAAVILVTSCTSLGPSVLTEPLKDTTSLEPLSGYFCTPIEVFYRNNEIRSVSFNIQNPKGDELDNYVGLISKLPVAIFPQSWGPNSDTAPRQASFEGVFFEEGVSESDHEEQLTVIFKYVDINQITKEVDLDCDVVAAAPATP